MFPFYTFDGQAKSRQNDGFDCMPGAQEIKSRGGSRTALFFFPPGTQIFSPFFPEKEKLKNLRT